MKIIIIGGVAFGATFATKFRRLNEKAQIIIFEQTNNISYANCGLPYYLSKTIPSKDSLILQDVKNFSQRYNINVYTNTTVYEVDFENKLVKARHLDKTVQEQKYDKLIIATGTKAKTLNFLENKTNVFNLKTVEHALAIDNYLQNNNVQEAVVLGSGFIGLEVAENLAKNNIKVTIVESGDQLLAPFDPEMAYYMEKVLKEHDFKIIKNQFAVDFDEQKVTLANGQTIKTDLLISSIGVVPNTSLFANTNLSLDNQGYVNVNDMFETNIKDVYAGGDIIKPVNKIIGEKSLNQLANPANFQAVMLANILNGANQHYNQSITTSIIGLNNSSLAQCGINEKTAKLKKLDYQVILAHINNHVSYYPNAQLIHFKVLINPKTGQIYGAQAFSKGTGVDKRIDMLSMAIKFNLKIQDLVNIETTYAPQFGAAKDPVMMLGYIGKNIVEGTEDLIQFQDLTNKHQLLFVVDENELANINLNNIINIPLNNLRANLSKLDKSLHYVISCKVGARAHNAVMILRNNGFKASNLAGGYLSINHYKNMLENK